MSKVDWNFIRSLEGFETRGYVPDAGASASGVTIGTGFDLGARQESDLEGMDDDLIEILTPFLGFKGAEAEFIAQNLNLTEEQANRVDKFAKDKELDKLRGKWNTATQGSFDDLTPEQQTVVASVAFQYGDLESKTPNFWRQVTGGQWDEALANLRNFGDRYSTRRNKEADFLEAPLVKKKLVEAGIPLPEEGSFAALFEPSEVGAEFTFALPKDYRESASQKATRLSLNEYEKEAKEAGFPKNDLYRDLHNQMYGSSSERYGTRVPSQLDIDTYEYSLFMPTVAQTWAAGLRQYHVGHSLGRMINNSIDPRMRAVPGYSAFNDTILKKEVGEDGLFFFRHSGSHAQSMQKLRRMREDRDDMFKLQVSPIGGSVSIGSSILTPTLFAPIAPVKIMRAGPVRRFFGGAAFTYLLQGGQQGLIETQNEARDASHSAMALAASSILGGTLTVAFGKNMAAVNTAKMRYGEDYERLPQSAGASANPETVRTTAYRQIEMEGMEETGIGIEKLGWNPVNRMLASPNPFVRNLAVGMVDVGGVMQKKVRSFGIEMDQSVEATFRTTYLPKLLEAIRIQDEAYLAYRNVSARSGDKERAIQMFTLYAGDIFRRADGTLSEVQFRQRVGMAMIRGDIDNVGDEVSEFVTRAAQGYRPYMNFIKEQAEQVGLFTKQLEKELDAARRSGQPAQVRALENELRRVQEMGVNVNTAQSYLPRIFRVDKIEENVPRFLSIVRNYFIQKGEKAADADRIAAEILDNITRRKPFIDLEGGSDYFDFIKNSSGAQRRTFEIPDELIEEFLERDVESIIRHHTFTMGMDIELARRYGSFDMSQQIDDIGAEYDRLISETTNFARRSELARAKEADIRDTRALRDRLRGTYGASKDPHTLSSRSVRVMKSFNTLVGMGSAMVSSVPDIARLVMVEGFANTYHKGFKALFDNNANIVREMAKPELNKAAIAVDAVLGLRARAMSDMGDLFGSRYQIERSLNDATGMFFLMNGLNIWNQALKEISGNITMLRMTESLMKKGGWSSLTRMEREKLLKNGIGKNDYKIMRKEIRKNGFQENGEWLPNTDGWSQEALAQRLKFRNALNQNVERIIITPGAGDRALWTSTELGSLLTQFKSFGQGAMVRMLTAGLQEKDAAFWQGAFLIVGIAAMVNEIKRAQYGITHDETADQKLINAIDRSGILGWFTDVNNAIEKVSDYKLGMRPLLTDMNPYPVHSNAKISSIFGPAASTILNANSVLGDVLRGDFTQQTSNDLRFIFPAGNLFYLDPIMDGVFGGNVNRQQEANRR